IGPKDPSREVGGDPHSFSASAMMGMNFMETSSFFEKDPWGLTLETSEFLKTGITVLAAAAVVGTALWTFKRLNRFYHHYVYRKTRDAVIQKLVERAQPILVGRGGDEVDLKIYRSLLECCYEMPYDFFAKERPRSTGKKAFPTQFVSRITSSRL